MFKVDFQPSFASFSPKPLTVNLAFYDAINANKTFGSSILIGLQSCLQVTYSTSNFKVVDTNKIVFITDLSFDFSSVQISIFFDTSVFNFIDLLQFIIEEIDSLIISSLPKYSHELFA
ncbi:MAG: hypothetical protein LBP22_03565 [Deltaproteobacteria bacterium]|jgi:hypothetical protein|nr:hypothetical protein [Deltaproteobacteria bacterium]